MTKSNPNVSNRNLIKALENELKERKNKFGINHSSVAETLNSLALTYLHVLDDHKTALLMHCEAKRILEQKQTEQN